MMLAAPRYLPETQRRPGQLDAAGAVSSTLGMTALVYGIVRSAEAGWTDALTLTALAASVLLLALFVANERRAAQPIMPLRLFSSRERAGAYAARLLFLGAMAPFWFFTTQFLQNVAGYSPVQAGLAFLPTTVINVAAAMAVPRLTRRFGNAAVLAAGLAISLIGMAWLGRLSAGSPYLTGIALPMILIGGWPGPRPRSTHRRRHRRRRSRGRRCRGRRHQRAHQLGGSLGLGVLVAVFAAADSSTLHGAELLAHRIGASLTVRAGLLALALVIALAARPAERGSIHRKNTQGVRTSHTC
jgi:predicted MFS family arabinose efflux permease